MSKRDHVIRVPHGSLLDHAIEELRRGQGYPATSVTIWNAVLLSVACQRALASGNYDELVMRTHDGIRDIVIATIDEEHDRERPLDESAIMTRWKSSDPVLLSSNRPGATSARRP